MNACFGSAVSPSGDQPECRTHEQRQRTKQAEDAGVIPGEGKRALSALARAGPATAGAAATGGTAKACGAAAA